MSLHHLTHNINDYPIEAQEDFLLDATRARFKQDLFDLAKYGLGYNEMTERTHGPICDMLMSPSKKKLLVVPRSCFKSSLASISYPIWLLIRDHNERILIDSELFTNSSKFLREIKGHLTSPLMVKLFGQFKTDFNWNDSEITIKQRTKIYKESSITCSGIGAQKTSQHYSVIIADDLSSLDNSMTADQREKVVNHYKLYISLLEPNGTLVVIGTRYSQGDIIGHILDNEVDREMKNGLVY